VEDLGPLLRLETLCFPTPWTERQFKLAFEMNLFYVFGLKSAGRLVGYISFYCSSEHMEILNLGIEPEFRTRGLARRMLGLTLKIARKLGAEYSVLEVRESNVPARRLYDGFGFKQVGLRKAYYPDNKEDALVLRLDFEPKASG
jgi:ribosomal-protein-alanine N-acetyltransferase